MGKTEWFLAGIVFCFAVLCIIALIVHPKSYEEGVRDCALGKVKYQIEVKQDTTVRVK